MSASKHMKTAEPSDLDLRVNPGIGASKGLNTSGADFEDIEGETTFEGDTDNDTNAQGGIDKNPRNRRR